MRWPSGLSTRIFLNLKNSTDKTISEKVYSTKYDGRVNQSLQLYLTLRVVMKLKKNAKIETFLK